MVRMLINNVNCHVNVSFIQRKGLLDFRLEIKLFRKLPPLYCVHFYLRFFQRLLNYKHTLGIVLFHYYLLKKIRNLEMLRIRITVVM